MNTNPNNGVYSTRPLPPSQPTHGAPATADGMASSSTGGTGDSGTTVSSSSMEPAAAQPRVVFGRGVVAQLPSELDRLGLSAPIIISSPSRVALARRVQTLIPELDSRILDSSVTNVPARVVEDVVSRISGRDCVISVGGGSAISLGKAICIRKRIPHVCIPTTYSSSEMMPVLGHGATSPNSRRRFASGDPRTLPTVILYDEDLTKSVSKRISAPSESSARAESKEFDRLAANDDNPPWSFINLPGV